MPHPEIPAEALIKEEELANAEPEVNPWACIILLIITVALMGVTAEFVRFTRLSLLAPDVISYLPSARRQHKFCPNPITDKRRVRVPSPPLSYLCKRAHSLPYHRWFGIILLPIVSFSADGAVAIAFFLRSFLRRFITAPQPPDLLAEARAIDLSIQFLLFWMPVVTLLGWWINKPMSLLFGKKKISPHSS
jgi:Ca2+:H+ antiporter